MQHVYLFCFIFSIGMLLWLKAFEVKHSIDQFIYILIISVSNLGFYFVSVSSDIEDAVFSQKMACLGGAFLPIFFFFLVLDVCHIELNRFISIILMIGQGAIYAAVLTIDSNTLFYKSMELGTKGGVTFLDTVNGPLHILYPGMMIVYFVASVVAAIYSLKKKKSVDIGLVISLILFVGIAIVAYILEVIGVFSFEIVPIVYDVLMVGAMIPIYDSNLFTVYENQDIINEQFGKVGFLTFDIYKIYKGCNEYMSKIFPELMEFRLGRRITSCSEELRKVIKQLQVFENMYRGSSDSKKIQMELEPFTIKDQYYVGIVHGVTNSFGRLRGYTIEIKNETEHHRALNLIEHYNEELTNNVREKTRQIREIQAKVILGMAQMVESRDLTTGGHIKRTSEVVRIFSTKLVGIAPEYTSEFLDLVIRSAPMHDLGKIGIDDAILRKKTGLTDEDFETMKGHPNIGYRMVCEILSGVEEEDFVNVAKNIAHYHHEKMDGSGYPEGLKGDEIPLEARIMAIADVFDALVSKRSYKEALSCDEALEIIKNGSGTHFDSQLVDIFITCKPELEEYIKKGAFNQE